MDIRRLPPALRTAVRFALGAAVAGVMPAVPGEARAQEAVYRCGPDGRSYSQTPCEGGRRVEVGDPRSPQQQVEAEAQRRQLLEQARALPERAPEAPRGAGLIHTRRPPEAAPAKARASGPKKPPAAGEPKAVAPAPEDAASIRKKKRRRSGA
ncbi:hypothetical protein [Caldimonas tepidiphila]|uniref:hypothetical protein n=1 Tax=Caldimonas tepidiphila TaxID=2315841 RepID=UPI000E5A90B0|nr:hypothetical protein [Caldimonas tepidiphila]